MILDGKELDTLRKLNDNYTRYDEWEIYDKKGTTATKKEKNEIKRVIMQSRHTFIETEWCYQYEDFLIAVIGMKDSWRAGIPDKDKTKLVTTGIYKYSRNPAFLGFDMMYIGLLLMYGNPLNLIFTIFAIIMLHFQILQEEKFLCEVFGDDYLEYRKKVFRYLGRKYEIFWMNI